MNREFRAWRMHSEGEGVVARLDTLTLDDLAPGDVVIRAEYSDINYKDALAMSGKGKIMRRFPLVAGIDVAGCVVESENPAFRAGDRVLVTGCGLGEDVDGGFSEYVRLPAKHLIRIPDALGTRAAMQLGTAGFTAALALYRMEQNGQKPAAGPIAVTGASGGVGSLAVAIFAQRGYGVVAYTGKREARDWLRRLGASKVLDPSEANFGARPLESARYAGAVDCVGGELLGRLLAVINWWGNVAAIGNAAGAGIHASVYPFILRGVSLLGINSVATPRTLRETLWRDLAHALPPAVLETIANREIPLAAVAEAVLPLIENRAPPGRTLIHIAE